MGKGSLAFTRASLLLLTHLEGGGRGSRGTEGLGPTRGHAGVSGGAGFVPSLANPSSAPPVSPGQWVGNRGLTGTHLVPELGSGLSLAQRLGSKTGPLPTRDKTTWGKGVGAEDAAGSLWGPAGSLGVRDGEQGVTVCQALSYSQRALTAVTGAS